MILSSQTLNMPPFVLCAVNKKQATRLSNGENRVEHPGPEGKRRRAEIGRTGLGIRRKDELHLRYD